MNSWIKAAYFVSAFCGIVLLLFFVFNYGSYFKAMNFLKKGIHQEAKREFSQFFSKNPRIFESLLNLAWIESLQKNPKKALGHYGAVIEESQNSRQRFESYFNSAVTFWEEKNLDEALKFYQSALVEDPDSIEVKTNIELMMKNQQQKNKDQKKQETPQNSDAKEDSNSKQDSKQDSKNGDSDSKPLQDSQKNPDSTPPASKDLDSKQMEFIFKELENREKELKYRLHKSKAPERGSKGW